MLVSSTSRNAHNRKVVGFEIDVYCAFNAAKLYDVGTYPSQSANGSARCSDAGSGAGETADNRRKFKEERASGPGSRAAAVKLAATMQAVREETELADGSWRDATSLPA